jgi:mannose-6-phosphate isomerase-like protein (cupin superfamily)
MSKWTLRAIAACALLLPTAAVAASCPAEHVLTEPREIENAPDIGIDRPVLATVDLTGWRGMGNFMLRMRRITVAPDGVVPTHWHNDRPSIVFIMEGEIIEHSTFCAVPILHKAGEWTPEFGPFHGHWWENKSGKPVVILSTDVVPFENKDDPNM